jgi:hypothetical protein
LPAQLAHAAKQAQAGADVEQQRVFFGQRQLRRIAQQRQRHRLQGFRFALRCALMQLHLRRHQQRTATPHAHPHTAGVGLARYRQHALLLQHGGAAIRGPAGTKHFER